MGSGRKYDEEYKVNAVKLAEKIGAKKAADELGIPDNTLYGWVRAAKSGHLNVGTRYRTPEDNLKLAEENAQLRKQLKEQEKEKMEGISIPSERTVYRVMEEIGLVHHPKRKPNGITKADREAQKSDDKLKRDFTAEEPDQKAVTDITEIKCKDGKLYVSALFDCFDLMVFGLSMDTNMKADLCARTVKSAC